MSHDHIVKSFDNELDALDNLIAKMGGLVETQLSGAIDGLINRDVEKAAEVASADKRVDALEQEVDTMVVRLLALRQPMAGDLRAAITALKVASLIERIGDYSKNIAKRTAPVCQSPSIEPIRSIGRMGEMVQGMIKEVLDAYVSRDAEKAERVRQSDEEVDALHTSLFREILTYMMEDPRNITACSHLLFVAKNIERIGDHTTNIAENIIFLVKGEMPDDNRPKGDKSSYTVVAPGKGGGTA